MASVLHLDSSPRNDRSKSRALAKEFITAWQNCHPADVVTYRDLRETLIPHVTEEWIAADFTPPEALTPEAAEVLRLSDELVNEFLIADCCIFSVPMYNFSLPSNFKAYIDQIVRVDRTFTLKQGQFKGLAGGKKVLFITARGSDYSADSPYAGWDAQEPALRFAFQFMGVTDIQFIHASGLDLGNTSQQQGLDAARSQIRELIDRW